MLVMGVPALVVVVPECSWTSVGFVSPDLERVVDKFLLVVVEKLALPDADDCLLDDDGDLRGRCQGTCTFLGVHVSSCLRITCHCKIHADAHARVRSDHTQQFFVHVRLTSVWNMGL